MTDSKPTGAGGFHPPSEESLQRGPARLPAVQALFQWLQGGGTPDEVIRQFVEVRANETGEGGMPVEADREFFADIVRGAARNRAELDDTMRASMAEGWSFERMDPLLRAILLAGLYELNHRLDVPVRALLAAYVKLARSFFEGGPEPAFINSVLDRHAKTVRVEEFTRTRRREQAGEA